jgi:hypothetical protein
MVGVGQKIVRKGVSATAGLSSPETVQVRDDAVNDAVAACGIGEAGQGAGASSHFTEGAFDDVGGADFPPVRFRNVEKAQEVKYCQASSKFIGVR